jgi:Short C-terminal domain
MTEAQRSSENPMPTKARSYLESMLVPGESIQSIAIQRRLFALLHRRSTVAATTGRLIGMSRGLIGGFTPIDIRWQDIKTAHIRAGIFASSLKVTALMQPDLASGGAVRTFEFTGLRKDEAQDIYRICQAQEQAWREKRRLRELEELRAKSGGFQGSLGSSTSVAAEEPTERLRKAKTLLDQGLISDSEYETIKARVIGQL